jgi:hypothetical protein
VAGAPTRSSKTALIAAAVIVAGMAALIWFATQM